MRLYILGRTTYEATQWARKHTMPARVQPICVGDLDVTRGIREGVLIAIPGALIRPEDRYILQRLDVVNLTEFKYDPS